MGERAKFPLLHLGTSSFTADGWNLTFYPPGMRPRDYLSYYATQFDTLEVDATFYRIPSTSTVRGWYERTPGNFVFALKAPQEITHERVLVDVNSTLRDFLLAVEPLGEKLGVVLLQFPYFNKKTFASGGDFLLRLAPFLEQLPQNPRFALEIRNKFWLGPPLLDLLRKHRVALTLVDHPWMPQHKEYGRRPELITTDFTYIRWLGDRHAIEEFTKLWDRTIVDRSADLEEWVKACRTFMSYKIRVYAFANNHYAGHAPATLRSFTEMLNKET